MLVTLSLSNINNNKQVKQHLFPQIWSFRHEIYRKSRQSNWFHHVRGFGENFWFILFLQYIQHSLRKKIMQWKTIAYQFWFFKLKQYFRYLDLNQIFINLQVAPSLANLFKQQTKQLWTVWRADQYWQSHKLTFEL